MALYIILVLFHFGFVLFLPFKLLHPFFPPLRDSAFELQSIYFYRGQLWLKQITYCYNISVYHISFFIFPFSKSKYSRDHHYSIQSQVHKNIFSLPLTSCVTSFFSSFPWYLPPSVEVMLLSLTISQEWSEDIVKERTRA